MVVDPGVGTERRLLYAEVGPHRLLLPDNGLLTILARALGVRRAIQLREPQFWRQPVSATFHGRDILAPVAARLSLGLDPTELGPVVADLVELPIPAPVITAVTIEGEVLWVDSFGNLLTNIRQELLKPPAPQIRIGSRGSLRWVRTYGDAAAGELVALVSSGGYLEVAVVQGSAAQSLNVGRGTPVTVRF